MAGGSSADRPDANARVDDDRARPNPSDLDARKARILETVVAEHIESGQPVGSAHLSASTGLGVSSATIRNEMQQLERDGYLTHPHTSAGRIPTDRGYRFFVDRIDATRPAKLLEPKAQQVRQFFEGARTELEQLLNETTRLLSNLTDYAAVVVGPPTEVATVRSVQVVALGPSSRPRASASPEMSPPTMALVVAVLSNGTVDKATVELPPEAGDAHIGAASAHLTKQLSGSALAAAAGAHPSAPPLMRTGQAIVDGICDIALAALRPDSSGPDSGSVFVGGTSRMIGAFETVDTVRRVLAVLEEQFVVVNLLREALERSSSVSIGTEHAADRVFENLLTCSVVVAPYHVDGRPAGTIGVLGPTRMDYPQAMAAVASVSEALTEKLADPH